MGSLITFGISATLLVLFVTLSMRERRVGSRVFGNVRTMLDQQVEKAERTLRHVHIGLVISHVFGTYIREFTHEVIQVGLAVVKVLERALMRTREGVQKSTLSPKSQTARSHFLEALSRFRKRKKTVRGADKNEEVG